MVSFWGRLLARLQRPAVAKAPLEPSARVASLLAEMRARSLPCLRLIPGGDGRSHLGGSPILTGPWPRYAGRPLSLVAQLDLAEMQAAGGGPDWLPKEGRLLFFYELEHSGWGFDPKDAGCAVVRWEAGPGQPAAEPDDLPADMRLDPYPVGFVADVSAPSDERLGLDWNTLTPAEEAELEAAVQALGPADPAHQVGGYPGQIQWDQMEMQCQLASNGVYLGKGAAQGARVDELRPGAADWRLLLQIDTDEEAELMWGDTGRLYFWIREQDARAADFSRVWAILQCY